MKLAVVLGLVAVAFASTQWETRPDVVRERAFREGQHYTYHFDGQVSSGLPIPSSQHAATRVQSIVSLVFENDRSALLKLQKIRLGSAHRDLVEPRDLQPFGLFEEIQVSEEQKEKLSLPVRFRYEHGLVTEVEFDGSDEAWSENIKRAVVNMLQLNLAKKSRTDEAEMSRLMRDTETSEKPEQDYFTTQEMTLEGDCETAYTVAPAGEEKLRVSKSINFDKCAKRVDIRYNFRFGEECPSCEKKFYGEERNTESSTVFKFELNGDINNFLIREVELRSHYNFAPLSQEQGHMATFVANKLTLVKVDSSAERVPVPRSEKKSSLVYSTEWEEKLEQFRMTGEESLIRESPFPWMSKKIEIARKIVEEIKSEISTSERDQESFTPALNHQIARLVEVLRVCSKEEIKKIAHEMKQEQQLASIFHDALAIAGTKNTIEYLAEHIVEREVSPLKASRLLKELMNVRNPSEKIIDIIVRLAKEEIAERNPVLKQSAWLTVGSLLNGLCGDKRDRFAQEITFDRSGKKTVCPRQLKEKYVQLLENLFAKAETRYEKTLALKTIANSGMDLIVFPLEKIIKNEREEKSVRIQAIDALRKLRSVMPRKMHSILMPIFKNAYEFPELRVAAFHQIMQTLPERVIIDQITQQLEKERSSQVHAFVYTSLKSLAKSDIPCEQEMARDIEQSLTLARVQPRRLLDSHLLRASLYDNEYFTGAALNWAMLFSNDSVLPKEITASLDSVFGGEWNKYLAQIGFAQQNIDQVLYKLLERLENSESSSYDDVIVRGKRSSALKPAEALRKLMEKMGIQQRRYSEKQAHATLYLRYKDMDYAVLPIDEENLPGLFNNVVKGGKLHLGEIERVLAKGYRFSTEMASFLYETTRTIPTTLGLPLEISGKLPTIFSVEGHIQAELEPKSGNGINGLRLKLQAQPELASTHITHMEIRSPLVSSGVKIVHSGYAQLPIDIEAELNWEKKFDIKVVVKAPKSKEQRVLSLNTRPVTYIRHENSPRKMESAVEKTIFLSEQPTSEIDTYYGEKALGVRFNVRGQYHRHMLEKMQQGKVLPIFVCENHLEVTMEAAQETPREYVIRMNIATFDQQKMSTEQPEFDGFYTKENRHHFEVEDSEYLKENEDERQNEFTKYVKSYKGSSNKPAYSHRVHIKTEAVGSSVERMAEVEIKSVCDETLTFCKWIVEATRSPILSNERRQWTLSAAVQTLFPEPVMSLKQLREQKHRELTAVVDAKWGSEQKNTLKLRVQGEQSKEQQQWQQIALRKADKQEEQTVERLETLVLASRLNQIKIVAEYDIVPETQVQLARVSALLKAWKPLTSSVEPRITEKTFEQQGRVLAKLTVEPQTWRYLNLSVESPAEKMVIENIRLPFRPTWISIEKTQAVRGVRDISRRLSSEAVCEVSSSRVNTFDEVVYRAPLTTCYSVLAKDCSSKPSFAVLMKNVQKNGEEKKMKIVTEDNVIEIEMRKGDLIVKVDGKTIKEEELENYNMEQRGDMIVFENSDVFVRFDGYKAEIKLNELYKNKQCGMCGHYDGEYEGEFRRADNQETEDVEEFHRSFLSRDDECEMEEEKLSKKDNYKKFDKPYKSLSWDEQNDSEESIFESRKQNKWNKKNFEEEDTVEPEQKTRVIEYSSKVCFSKEPVAECPRKTREADEKETKVRFACLERSSSQARRLLREARDSILSIDELPHSFVETLSVPAKCIVY